MLGVILGFISKSKSKEAGLKINNMALAGIIISFIYWILSMLVCVIFIFPIIDGFVDRMSDTYISKDDDSSNRYFTISEWGIKGVWNEDYGIKYKPGVKSYVFTTDNMTGSCVDFPIGAILRLSENDHVGDVHSNYTAGEIFAVDKPEKGDGYGGNKKIGEYYYFWGYGIADKGCYQDNSTTVDTAYTQASSKVHEFFNSIQGI